MLGTTSANEAFEKVASYGLVPNMILHLMRDYKIGVAKGTNILFLWTAASSSAASRNSKKLVNRSFHLSKFNFNFVKMFEKENETPSKQKIKRLNISVTIARPDFSNVKQTGNIKAKAFDLSN
ncbi:hypothetical protein R6Q59_011539 [Mikania micrantha]|uniref:Uncharacterized protein n=1 Tax=Mikania micrantha TaxID=192012 RepID=A0A5N6N2R3_9ASTR|nr:hypothetical protein E3N88_24545 [Mikania micrantha]